VNVKSSEQAACASDAAWKALYRIGAVAILVAVALFRRNYGVELVTFKGFGIWAGVPSEFPRSAVDWFALLQSHPFVGLNLLRLRDLVNYCLVGLFFLALGAALWKTSKSAIGVALASALVGSAVFVATNQAFSMLALSRQYAAAAGEVQRAAIEAAGEALLSIDNPGVPFSGLGYYAGLLLVTVAGLILSAVMLRSTGFGRATAWAGILANAFMLGLLVILAVAPNAGPVLLAIPPSVSAVFRVLWYVLSAITLFRMGKPGESQR
jgi:hypothetical protein